jgi:hypothetical protein
MNTLDELRKKKNEILMKITEQKLIIDDIDKQMELEQKRELSEQIEDLTDTLNSLFQHPILEKEYPSLCNTLYDVMNHLDKVAFEMSEELETLKL